MITATLSGEEPAPQEIQYPILMKDKRDGQIMLAMYEDSDSAHVRVIALSPPRGYSFPVGKPAFARRDALEVYHGEITLKNS